MLLLGVALWPCVTLVLQRQGLDPWKLMSFGMYAAPARRPEHVQVVVTVLRDGQWEAAPVSEDVERFKRWRRTLGRLEPASSLASTVNAATRLPVRVEVKELRLDAKTARVYFETERAERLSD